MTAPATCPECGTPLPPNDPRPLCVACLLKRGLEANTLGYTAPTSPFTPPPLEEVAAKFPELEILTLIGRGGMGAVYKARQKNLDRIVALKILPPQIAADPAGGGFAERFAREAQAMAKLNHPHIVNIHEFGDRTGLFYFLMEFVDGLNLRSLLDSGHVSPKEALAIVPQICDALQYAHEQGIVHRDIKPENILLSKQGQVKIADFGLAKLMGRAAPGAEKIMGTPQYMAPEQLDHPNEVDHRADIYSLGVVFYQMLTGELPQGKFEAPSKRVQIDVRLDEIVLKALEREPGRRYQQVSEVKTQVETIAGMPPPGAPHGNAGPLAPTTRTRISRWALAGLIWHVCFFTVGVGGAILTVMGAPLESAVLSFALEVGTWLSLLGLVGAPFCGIMGMREVRAGGGRVAGLKLAAADVLLTILPIDAILVWATCATSLFVAYAVGPPIYPIGPWHNHPAPVLWTLSAIGSCFLADWAIIRWVRRAAKGPETTAKENEGAPLSHATSRNLALIAFTCAFLSGLIPTIFYWLAPWLLPWLSPQAQQFMLWLTLVVAILALLLGIRAGKSWQARTAVISASVSLVIWLLMFVAGTLSLKHAPMSLTDLAERPYELQKLPTRQVIDAGLSKPLSPWAWKELEERSLSTNETALIMEGLTAWMEREYPDGTSNGLAWLDGFLQHLAHEHLATEQQSIQFIQAMQGRPRLRPAMRIRQGKTVLDVSGECGNPFQRRLMGFAVLQECREVTIDGQPLPPAGSEVRRWDTYWISSQVKLPALSPGKHVLRMEMLMALVPEEDVAGLPNDAPSSDWPPAKKQWVRTGESELLVYPKDAVIVKQTEDARLDPLATGALAVDRIIVRPKGNQSEAVVIFRYNEKANIPISFDVALRVGGRTLPCSQLYSGSNPNGTLFLATGNELKAETTPLDPAVKEADVVLTPNPKPVEEIAGIDRIWGKALEFKGIKLERQDLVNRLTGAAIKHATPNTSSIRFLLDPDPNDKTSPVEQVPAPSIPAH